MDNELGMTHMDGHPIRDISQYPMEHAGFLGAERNLLIEHGYVFEDGFWVKK